MRLVNSKTKLYFDEGELYSFNGKDEIIEKRTVKVQSISDLEKQISVKLLQKDGSILTANFWKATADKNPNMFIEDGSYKLVEISVGDTIDIWGVEYDYNGFKQFNAIGGYQLSDEPFEQTNTSSNVVWDKLNRILSYVQDSGLKKTCNDMLQDIGAEFSIKPAANKHHHNYLGGLLQHTYEVVGASFALASVFKVDLDIVITAALFHDSMKVKEYTDAGDYLPYALTIGHVVGSANYFKDLAIRNNVDNDKIEKIYHCIIAHHGKKEWGSPVEPQTLEAAIIHEADMISSKVNPIATKDISLSKDHYLA